MNINPITLFFINLFLSLVVSYLGRNRKWGFWGYFWPSLLLTPLFGLILILASDPKKQDQ